jgi:paraquat-inducible protein B
MPAEKSYARLGSFIVISLVVLLATAVLFIQRMRSREVIALVTYTTENVSGLDISSPVRFRGVPVGRITNIRVDPRGTMVEVSFELFLDHLNTVGLDVPRIKRETDLVGYVFPRTRARIMGNPVTGEAYLLLDTPQNPPPPMELAFKPSKPYVPSMPSSFSTMQDRLPELLDRAEATLQLHKEIIDKLSASLDRNDKFFTHIEGMVRQSDLPALSADSRKFFTTTTAQMEKMRSDLDGVIGREGTFFKFSEEARAAIRAADFPAMNQSVRDAAENSRLASDDLRRSMPAIRDSLEQMRELSRMLEAQPESMVYGPRPAKDKP